MAATTPPEWLNRRICELRATVGIGATASFYGVSGAFRVGFLAILGANVIVGLPVFLQIPHV